MENMEVFVGSPAARVSCRRAFWSRETISLGFCGNLSEKKKWSAERPMQGPARLGGVFEVETKPGVLLEEMFL